MFTLCYMRQEFVNLAGPRGGMRLLMEKKKRTNFH